MMLHFLDKKGDPILLTVLLIKHAVFYFLSLLY